MNFFASQFQPLKTIKSQKQLYIENFGKFMILKKQVKMMIFVAQIGNQSRAFLCRVLGGVTTAS
jgi:hypothetical protein